MKGLKIDAGLLVYDEFGLYRAVSDITRSVVGSDDARWFYQLLDHTLVSSVIAGCRAGRTGEEVFRSGMAPLEEQRKDIVSAGFAPEVASLTNSFKPPRKRRSLRRRGSRSVTLARWSPEWSVPPSSSGPTATIASAWRICSW